MKLSYHKKTKKLGPGGAKCRCCVPVPSRHGKLKRALNKEVRSKSRLVIQKLEVG